MVVKQIVEPGQTMAFETRFFMFPLAHISLVALLADDPDGAACRVCIGSGRDVKLFGAEADAFLAWYRRVVAVTSA